MCLAPPHTRTVELAAAIMSGKPIVFRCATATVLGPSGRVTVTNGGDAAAEVLQNFSNMVDVVKAECNVAADK